MDCSNLELSREIIEEIKQTPIYSGMEDRPIWNPTNSMELTSKIVYDEVRIRGNRGYWKDLIWFKGHIPKFSFVTWMVAKGRIPTFDRMIAWNLQTSGICLLCGDSIETRDHLFFDCSYSKHILETGLQWTCTRMSSG